MGNLFEWMDYHPALGLLLMLFAFAVPIAWFLEPILSAWQYSVVRRLRSDAELMAPDAEGRLPVARQTLETGALVPGNYGLVDPALIRPDGRGLMPLHRDTLARLEYTEQLLQLMASQILNGRPMPHVPASVTYAPHMAYRNDVNAQGADVQGLVPVVQPKDFWQLYSGGQLPDSGFLMGYSLADGEPVQADWKQLYSALIGGQSGSGKSTLLRNILAQSALQGGRFVVLDPHYGAGEESLGASLSPLRTRMLCDVAANDNQMSDALRFVADIGQRRLSGQDADRSPLILVVDETTALLQRGKVAQELTAVLGNIAQETRKVGIYALCIGQNFHSDVMPTVVRDSFVSQLTTRTRRDVARTQSGNTEFGKMAETLTTGQAAWMQPDGNVIKFAVPNTTQQHVWMVAQNAENTPKTGAAGRQVVDPLTKPLTNPLTSPLTTGSAGKWEEVGGLTAKQQNAIQMYLDGASKSQIIADLWGAKGGPPFQAASAEFDEALRYALKGGQ